MKKLGLIVLVGMFAGAITGCETAPSLSQEEITQRYPGLVQLGQQVLDAKDKELDILSPKLFLEANEYYDQALAHAKTGDPETEASAQSGLKALEQASKNATNAQDVLEDVLQARSDAIRVNASSMSSEGFAKAEKELLKLTGLMESGSTSKAKAGRSEVMKAYRSLELKAVKGNVVDQAKNAIALAEEKGIHKVAPKTMQLAREELDLALSTLDVDKTAVDKASRIAAKSLWNTQRAMEIVEVINMFENSKFDEEDKVLWYQDQVSKIVDPAVADVPFNQPNKQMVKDLRSSIADLQQVKEESTRLAQEKAVELQTVKEISEAERSRQAAIDAKFGFIQALYTDQEADVYRQMDNVLIRAHGFAFASGKSEIEAINFALMNKIIESLKEFPKSKIVVSGHTDNLGSANLNLELSEARAKKVAEFLTQVGRIPAERIQYVGYGKGRPVASNDTPEGRAANRRVEVLIVNNRVN